MSNYTNGIVLKDYNVTFFNRGTKVKYTNGTVLRDYNVTFFNWGTKVKY